MCLLIWGEGKYILFQDIMWAVCAVNQTFEVCHIRFFSIHFSYIYIYLVYMTLFRIYGMFPSV